MAGPMTMGKISQVGPDKFTKHNTVMVSEEKGIRMQVVNNAQGHMELNLERHGLRQVPVQVFHMAGIHVLRLARNQLDHLPMMIAYLRSLRTLDVSHNVLTKLPETLVNCRRLTRLDLSDNRLTTLPRTIGGLCELKHLDLARNLLEQLPHEVGRLTSLRVLNLHGNRLWHLPPTLEGLRQLRRLDVGDNLLDTVPLVVTRLTSLHALDISRNRLAALPLDTDKLKQLVELNLSHNKFLTVSSLLASLARLKYLSLADNGLKFLPVKMDGLQNLEVLHLQENNLRVIPSLPSSLKYYNVSKNQLTSLTVEGLRNLVSLTATHNRLDAAPRGVCGLKRLRFLYLDHNFLQELPADLWRLRDLRVLSLVQNDLRCLPYRDLLRLNKLASFNVKGNPDLTRKARQIKDDDDDNDEDFETDLSPNKVDGENNGATSNDETRRHKRKDKSKMMMTTRGKITFGDDSKAEKTRKDRLSPRESFASIGARRRTPVDDDRWSGTVDTWRTHDIADFTRKMPRNLQKNRHQSATFPGGAPPKIYVTGEESSQRRHKKSKEGHGKSKKKFSSMRSLKSLFFGWPRSNKKSEEQRGSLSVGSDAEDGLSSYVDPESRAAMRGSDFVQLPLSYHMDDLDRETSSRGKRDPRRSHLSPRDQALSSSRVLPDKNHPSRHGTLRETRSHNEFDGENNNLYRRTHKSPSFGPTGRKLYATNGKTKDNVPPWKAGKTRRNDTSLSEADVRQMYSKTTKHRSKEHSRSFHPSKSMPLHFKPAESWADQGLYYPSDKLTSSEQQSSSQGSPPPDYRDYNTSISGSWHRWGETVPESGLPSREHSVKEALASFATETPRWSHRGKVNHGNSPPFYEDRGSYLKPSRSEPTLYADEDQSYTTTYIQEDKMSYSSEEGNSNRPLDMSLNNDSKHRTYHQRRHSLGSDSDRTHKNQGSLMTTSWSAMQHQNLDSQPPPPTTPAPPHLTTAHSSHFPEFDHILSTEDSVTKAKQEPGTPRLTAVTLQHGDFLMKRKEDTHKPQLERSKSLDSILDYSPRGAPGAYPGASNKSTKEVLRQSVRGGDATAPGRVYPTNQELQSGSNTNSTTTSLTQHMTATDYSLLRVCNHVENMLNKDLLKPSHIIRPPAKVETHALKRAKSLNSRVHARASQHTPTNEHQHHDHGDDYAEEEEGFVRNSFKKGFEDSGLKQGIAEVTMKYSQPQTFTLTGEGGQFVSSGQPEIMVDVSAHAVRRNLNVTIQLLTISTSLLHKAKDTNYFVSNILSLGPLVYFYTDRPDVSLNSPATITIPAPPAVRGGHLVVLTIRKDNTCLPVSSGYRSGRSSATLTSWQFMGKIAVLTKAKCRYKACKSVEQLLLCIGAAKV